MMFRKINACLTAVVGLLLATPLFAAEPLKQNPPRTLASDPVGFVDYVQMFLGLALVLGLIVGMAWLIRRMGSIQQFGQGAMKIIGGLSVGQRERVVLLQVGETQILLGLAPGQIRTLHVLDKPITPENTQQKNPVGFAERLQSVMQGKVR